MKTSTCNQTYMYSWYSFFTNCLCVSQQRIKISTTATQFRNSIFPQLTSTLKTLPFAKLRLLSSKEREDGWISSSEGWRHNVPGADEIPRPASDWKWSSGSGHVSHSVCVSVCYVCMCALSKSLFSCITTCSYKIGALLWMGWQKGYEHLSHWQYRVRVAGRGEVHVRERKGEGERW